jgi:uncharacterized membrane protein YcaP (DUF421 family)
MTELIEFVFGHGELTWWQMGARAVAMFIIALALVRLSGRRSFGQHSPFDACTTVLVGAVLSRGLVGASDFWPTVSAATAIVLMHRVVGLASVRWPKFERMINGHEIHLVRGGQVDQAQMRKALISVNDLEEAVRKKTGDSAISKIQGALLERNGDITILGERA